MSNYTVTTDFLAKDALAPGNPSKKVKGSEFDVEFDNIATHMATKANAASPALTGTPTLDGVSLTATANELNILDGATLTTTELNYVDGVTSAIQTQLNLLAPKASPTFTGTLTAAAISATSMASSGAVSGTTGTFSSTLTGATVYASAGEVFSYGFSGSSGSGVLRLNQAGTAYLYWNGSVFSLNGALSVVGTVSSTSTFTGTDFIISSDARLKKDIRRIENSGTIVDALTGYRFAFKDTDVARTGVIAQEVQQVLPELVHAREDGMLTVSEGGLVAVLIEEVKALRTRVAMLEAR